MQPPAGSSGKSESRHLTDLDRHLAMLVMREDESSTACQPACYSPFHCALETEDVEDGSPLQAEYERRLGARPSSAERKTSKAHESAGQEQLGGQPGAAQEQAAPLASGSTARSEMTSSWAKVVVTPFPALRVQNADVRWLRLFGFTSSDMQNKSLRIATGPKTKMEVLKRVCASATTASSPTEFATFYAKSGDELSLILRATRENGEGHIAIEMQSLDANLEETSSLDAALEGDRRHLEEEASIHLSSQAPHAVLRANPACEAFLGVTEARLKERGMEVVFSEQTSLMRWKNLLKGAAEGATRACHMTLRGATGINNALIVDMEVSPDTATPRVARLYPTVVVRMRLALDTTLPGSTQERLSSSSGSSPSSSFEDAFAKRTQSVTSTAGAPFTRATSSGSDHSASSAQRAPSEGAVLDSMGSTARAHLRAFVAAGRRKREDEERRKEERGEESTNSM
ncbi:hypothetical protein T484DRAFT_1981575 [Baffinella frigidus]|nr:hypothetical protein T484DRAFT_1981575 [Cryptophyta sp. CCMP2293]